MSKLFDEKGRPKYAIDKRFLLILFGVVLTLAFVFSAWNRSQTNSYGYENCTQAKADGHKNIPKGDQFYNPAQDADKDGFACE